MSDSIKVAIKVRPLINRENDENLSIQWSVQGNSIAPLDPELKKRGEGFYFDHIFDMCQTNDDVFNTVAKPIVDATVNGFNGTIFAYGQTSSGKTYTMMGEPGNPGVIPLSVDYIFDAIANTYGREFLLRVSYIEIYNERINDLLDKERTDLKIEVSKSGQADVACKEEVINCPESVMAIMKKGEKNRRTGETNMNERSSRSHTIFRITIESRESNSDSDGAVHVSQLNLVDLAGSERAGQTGATGERFNEGRHINRSLSSLGLVIMQLSEMQENPQKFVNFRDSKLTRILQASLGGNAMTTIICAVTPAALEETQCTLAFASRAKRIKNQPHVNEVVSDAALLKRYAIQLAKLKAELEKAKSADVVEMESKLMEKDRANQVLEERIELLKTRIVGGNTTPDDEQLKKRANRRRTWAGAGTLQTKISPLQMAPSLPTIKELDNTPEKTKKKDLIKKRQSIIQSLDIPSLTFQTAFTDFELELIESERARTRLSDCSTEGDDERTVTRRPRRNVQFMDDVAICDMSFRSPERTPERKSPGSESPGTPKSVLRTRINFLMEQYNALTKDHRSLEEFTSLEKQLFVDEAVEKAMIERDKTINTLRQSLSESEQTYREVVEKYTKLQSHSSESDKRLAELEQKLAESANALRGLRSEKAILIEELKVFKEPKNRPEVQTISNNTMEIETSSIFANNTYFDDMNISNVPGDFALTSDTQNTEDLMAFDISTSSNNTTNNKFDESKRSKEITNAAYSEFMRQIGDKSSDELVRVMRELLNAKLSLEEETTRLEATLGQKIRESDDIKNDIRELKLGIEKLQGTIHLLMNENTDLTSKLTSEKERAREIEKNLQRTIDELNSNIQAIVQEKTELTNCLKEHEEKLKILPITMNDDKTKKLIEDYKKIIDSLTAENIEMSTNLMNKIEELDRLRDDKAPPGDHECAYRELTKNLSERNKLLETENIELSSSLMDKIEEYDHLKEKYEILSDELSLQRKSTNLMDISVNRSNLMDDEISYNIDTPRAIKITYGQTEVSSEKIAEIKKSQFSTTTVDDLLEMSNVANNSVRENSETIDDLLRLSIIPGEMDENEKNDEESLETWKLKAQMLIEQLKNVKLLNDKLSNLKLTSCTQCAHLVELRENRKTLKKEVKTLNRKLQDLQTKFDRECADTEILRTKASEDLNLSVCDSTLNGSLIEGGMNVSYVEERVQLLYHQLEDLKVNHDKLSTLYREKCDEIEKLHDGNVRETIPTSTGMVGTTTTESPKLRRNDAELDRIESEMKGLQNDLRQLKKSLSSVSAALQKFASEKKLMQNEIELLRNEKKNFEEKLMEMENSSLAREKIEALEKEVVRLGSEIKNSDVVKCQLENVKSSLEAEVQSLKIGKEAFEEKSSESKDQEKIERLENEVARLSAEIENSNIVKCQLEDAKSSLEIQKQFLETDKEALKEKLAKTEISSTALEKIEQLENEVVRLSSEIENSNIVKCQLEDAKSSLEIQLQLLETDKEALKEKLAKTEISSITREKIEELENEVACLSSEIENSDIVRCQLENAKLSLETKGESLNIEKEALEERSSKIEDLLAAQEKIMKLENEVTRLSSEIENANIVKSQLEIDKLSLEAQVQSLKTEKEAFREKLAETEISSTTQEKIEQLENEVARLGCEIENFNVAKCQLEDDKSSLEVQLQFLETDKEALKEKLAEMEISSTAQEKIEQLENEVVRLCSEIENVNIVKCQLKCDKSTLENEVQSLNTNKEKLEENSLDWKDLLNAREKIESLENELSRLSSEIEDANLLKCQLQDTKSSLETEIDSLKSERNIHDQRILELQQSLQNLEDNNMILKITLEKLISEKDTVVENSVISCKNANSSNNNFEAYEKTVESLQAKWRESSEGLQKYAEINDELNVRLVRVKTTENELVAAKSNLEDEIAAMKAEKTNNGEKLTNLSKSLNELKNEKSTLSRISKTLEFKLKDATDDLNKYTKENAELKEKLKNIEEKSIDEKFALTNEVTSLKSEITNLRESLHRLNETIRELEEKNSLLIDKLEESMISKQNSPEPEFDESPYKMLKEYEKMVGELQERLHEITKELQSNSKETIGMNDELTRLNTAREELNDMRLALEMEVDNLKIEKKELQETMTTLRATVNELDDKNAFLSTELSSIKAEKENLVSREIIENSDSYEKTIEAFNVRQADLDRELDRYSKENEELREKIAQLEEKISNTTKIENEKMIADVKNEKSMFTSKELNNERNLEELESARKFITKEIMSLKPASNIVELREKSINELVVYFVTTIMSKEEEVMKDLTDRFEREKRKLVDNKRQSIDAEKRAVMWAKELETDLEKTQQDLTRQESKNTELCVKIEKLENLLKESNHENQMLNEKMKVLEIDFTTLQADLEKTPEIRQNLTLNSSQEKERFIRETVDTREMELSSKLRLAEKQYREKLEELTINLEHQKSQNFELSNNLEGLEANERQLKNIIDIKTNELSKCNSTIERLTNELEVMTESHNLLSRENLDNTRQIDEITRLLKTKCDKLSEYKTKLESITPEYETLKEQASERQLKLEKYKSEIECLTTENEKNISSLKDRLENEEIKCVGYRKQLAKLTNRNTSLQTEMIELRSKCHELEISNEKLVKLMRNSTSKIRAEEEMEDLRDRNRILQRNLDGAGNRINELQDMKTRLMKDLVDLRVQYETTCNKNEEMKCAMSSHRSSMADTMELREKYEKLVQEKNRTAMELEEKKSSLLLMEKKIEMSEKENTELREKNKELDLEMDDIVEHINDLRKENAQLDDQLYVMSKSFDSQKIRIEELTTTNENFAARIVKYEEKIAKLKSQEDKLRVEHEIAAKTSEKLANENSELRGKLSALDSLSCGESSRSSSPVVESIRIDSRRRRSRNDLFNLNRPLEILATNEDIKDCRCEALKQQISNLEKEVAMKNAKIATLELKMQSEIFPHMKKCKDLEEMLVSMKRKYQLSKAETKQLEETRAQEMSSECKRCRQWETDKRDKSAQCIPQSEPIFMNGMSSGIVQEHMKMRKLEKDKETLKTLCRNRQKRIFELEALIKSLEKDTNNDEKSATSDSLVQATSSKLDTAINPRQAMKENVPTIWDNQRQPSHLLRRNWFN